MKLKKAAMNMPLNINGNLLLEEGRHCFSILSILNITH